MPAAQVQGLIRGTEQVKSVSVGSQGNQHVSKMLPDYAQLVAEGRVWKAQEATATASVVALPSTASLFTLVNNESDNGNWYVVLAVFAYNAANAAAIDVFGLAGCLSQTRAVTGGVAVTTAQDIAKTSIKSMCGVQGGTYNDAAILDTGVSITDDLWFPIASSIGSTGVNSATGGTLFSWMHGLVILPPKSLFGMVSTATSTSCTTAKGIIWAEVPRSYLLGS